MKAQGRPRPWTIAALLLFVLAFQGSRPLFAPDEGRYTAVALEMISSGDWIHPRLHQEVPHYSKPPLTYWMLASALRLGGNNEWAARVPNALLFTTSVLMLWRLGRRLVPVQPVLPALVYASFVLPYAASNLITTDTLLAATELLAMWGFVEVWWSDTRGARLRWGLLSASGAALAFLTKGPPGLLPLAAAVLFVGLSDGRSGFARVWSLRALLLFAALASSWYLKVALDKPDLWRYFLVEEVWNRVASSSVHRNEQWYGCFAIYLPTLLIGSLPWTPWLFGGLIQAVRERAGLWQRLRDDPGLLLPLCWLLLPLLVFFVVRSRLPLYVLPSFAPLALLIARRLAPLELASMRLRVLLGLWMLLLVVARAAPAWMDVPNDERRLADAVRALVPHKVDEVAFVETAPRYGLRLYLGSSIERINLPGTDAEPESEPLTAELAESEGCRLILVESNELTALQYQLRHFTRPWRELGLARGYRVLLLAGEDDCGLAAP
jgi:4-amino-4-deoxy-L-arabinose transferase-like glycosyltransferase